MRSLEVVAAHPARFLGAAIVPLQAPGSRGQGAGARGAAGVPLRGDRLQRGRARPRRRGPRPVWEAAQALDIALFVHPAAPVLGTERFRGTTCRSSSRNPLETALDHHARHLRRLLDRWPRLRWCFAHAGGAFAFVLGRVDRGWDVMPEGRAAVPRPPAPTRAASGSIPSRIPGPALRFIVDTHGADRVVLGSDYPFRMGYDDPVQSLDEASSTRPPVSASSRQTPRNSWGSCPGGRGGSILRRVRTAEFVQRRATRCRCRPRYFAKCTNR